MIQSVWRLLCELAGLAGRTVRADPSAHLRRSDTPEQLDLRRSMCPERASRMRFDASVRATAARAVRTLRCLARFDRCTERTGVESPLASDLLPNSCRQGFTQESLDQHTLGSTPRDVSS